MPLDGLGADGQPLGDRLVRVPCRHERRHAALGQRELRVAQFHLVPARARVTRAASNVRLKGNSRAGTGLIELAILGPFEASRDGAPVRVGAAKERALLALLVLHRGEVVPRDKLIEALWGATPPATAGHALEVYVSKLRSALGREVVETRAAGYALALPPDSVDADRFERLVDRAREEAGHDVASAAGTLREALGIWRGPALVDVAYEEFAQVEIGRLEELRLVALEERVEADLRLGRHGALVAELEALVREQPLRERLRGQFMLALYRSGRQADALEAFNDARETLLSELGLDPSPGLSNLQTSILRHDPALDVEPIELRMRRHLPGASTPFIGRQTEVAEIVQRFRERARLVTLVGPGGTGKTRLALEVAHDLARNYDDGVYFVDLAPIKNARLLEQAIASAVAAPDELALMEYLAPRRSLLVLDNFEHLDAAGPVVGDVLRRAPRVAVVVTSRTALRIYGEHVFTVPPLSQVDASSLFVARALAAGRIVQPSAVVDELCTWLDRLRLAIELVAARVRAFSPERILATLPSRLELATAGPRDAPERHRTLRATIDWSHGLLGDQQQVTFARISTFVGGFTPDAARDVCGAELTDLAALVTASLLLEIPAVGEPRLRMLETVREYARERADELTESSSLPERHAKYFLELAERAEPELERESAEWHERLEADYDNLCAAFDWFSAHGSGTDELRFAVALRRFWLVRGHASEGQHRLEKALARETEHPERLRATAMGAAAQLAFSRSDLVKAKELTNESLELARSLDDGRLVAFSFNRLADIAKAEDDYSTAGRHYESALDVARKLSDELPLAAALTNAGSFALMRDDPDEAEQLTREALDRWRALDNAEGIQIAMSNLAAVAIERGALGEAATWFEEGLKIARRLGFSAALAQSLGDSASVAVSIGALDRALVLIAAMDNVLETIGTAPSPHAARKREQAIIAVESVLSPNQIATLRDAGEAMSIDEALDFALETVHGAAARTRSA